MRNSSDVAIAFKVQSVVNRDMVCTDTLNGIRKGIQSIMPAGAKWTILWPCVCVCMCVIAGGGVNFVGITVVDAIVGVGVLVLVIVVFCISLHVSIVLVW